MSTSLYNEDRARATQFIVLRVWSKFDIVQSGSSVANFYLQKFCLPIMPAICRIFVTYIKHAWFIVVQYINHFYCVIVITSLSWTMRLQNEWEWEWEGKRTNCLYNKCLTCYTLYTSGHSSWMLILNDPMMYMCKYTYKQKQP